jgi:N-acetylneuraminic acid mutarotase
LQNKVIVAGGWGSEDRRSCEAFDQRSKQWTKIASLNMRRVRAAAATDDITMYVFGASDSEARDVVEQYDATADKWTSLLIRMPVRRYDSAAACINSYIYLLGGYERKVGYLESTDCMKPDKRGFLRKKLLSVPCRNLSAVSLSVSDEALWGNFLQML